jgi:hypothetical protein
VVVVGRVVLLSVAEVAALMGRSPGFVRGLVSSGRLPVAEVRAGERGGRPTSWFDPGVVFALLRDTPNASSGWWLTSA